jgi:hypothetical protein
VSILVTLGLLGKGAGGGGGGGGIPSSGLVGRWLSDTGVTTDGSGNVTAVADQSGLSNNLSGTTTSSVISNVLNGHPVIHHTGGALRKSSPSSVPSGDFTIFAVFRPGSGTTGRMAMFTTANSPSGIAFSLGNGVAGDMRVGGLYPGVAWVNSDTQWSDAAAAPTYDIVLAVRASGTLTFYKNGTTLGNTFTNSDANVGYTNFSIGDDGGGGNGASGYWAEWGVYNVALGSTDRASLFSVLGTKYGL